ncbi:EamA family transporter, partial [Burkholderia cenocepacia]|nr:EamA family transporter [Burkholderia cenocepacia]
PSADAATLLHAPLSAEFWQGASMVCGGSIMCWLATRSRRDKARPVRIALESQS